VSSPFGINELISLLARLRGRVREAAAKAEAMLQAHRSQAAIASRTCAAGLEHLAGQQAEKLAQAETEAQAARQRLQRHTERRAARIHEAHRTSRKRALDRINDHEGRQRYLLQKRALEAGRQRDTDLAHASTRLEQVRQQLNDSRERFAAMEERAQRSFQFVREFRRLLAQELSLSHSDSAADEDQLLSRLAELENKTDASFRQLCRNPLLLLFRVLPVGLTVGLVALGYGVTVFVLPRYGMAWLQPIQADAGYGSAAVILVLLYLLAKQTSRSQARTIACNLAQARHWHDLALRKAEERHRSDQDRLNAEWEKINLQLDEAWRAAREQAEQDRVLRPRQIDEKKARALQTNAQLHQRALTRIDQSTSELTKRLRSEAEQKERAFKETRDQRLAELQADLARQQEALEHDWQAGVQPIEREIQAIEQSSARLFPPWTDPRWETWTPPADFARAARFGKIEVELEKLVQMALPEGLKGVQELAHFSLPMLLQYPQGGSLLIETKEEMGEAIAALNTVIFRLLAASPPGQVNFTILDPIGLGQNFAGLMHLADYEQNQINGRIWTQTAQIEERLAELNEHMEKVIQMYLRNEFPTIAEYNAQAGQAAEKYHVVVVAGFPVNFSDTAARRLLNIAASGARCGVHLLVVWDQRQVGPHDFVPDELRRHCVRLVESDGTFQVAGSDLSGIQLKLDPPPPPDWVTGFLKKVGENAKDANRVELPFSQVAPGQGEVWSEDTAEEVRVPIGISGASKLQYLTVGRGTRQHALIAGKTGSGKSNLFHVIVTNLALWCSPEQVEFYLVDFKKGVEFKCYASRRLPHARVVAIESDREFGLSVLQRIDEELRRRGDLFRKAGVQEFAIYRKVAGAGSLPRALLLIDEFQEFFTEEDRISQGAAVLLDRIVRQGRAFGIHVVLGSQTLGGAYTLARATIGQMVIRVALQCNEADAYLIMDESNAAPRLLSRPGEGIYNDMAGRFEGNSPFQVVWFTDELREQHLARIRARADQAGFANSAPVVFEGNVPAEIEENTFFWQAVRTVPQSAPVLARVWLGAPNSIKGPTEAIFQRQSGSHLLIVGQDVESSTSLLAASLVALSAQYPPECVRLILLESTAPGTPERDYFDRTVAALRVPVLRPKRHELAQALQDATPHKEGQVSEEPSAQSPATFILISDLQEFKPLRQEDEFSFSLEKGEGGPSPAALLAELITEGPQRDTHLIVTVDNYNNVTRCLGRKLLSEFQMRVLFQMSPSDSASLIDSPEASKLGFHRALFYNEREGYVEKFRPYALPGHEWLEKVRHICHSGSGQ
jgi:S-DNA-T family DNA segregation ATPase FtsK/SpoIIIE